MKKITVGIVAHVDAGKTTLSEALLYQTGNLRKLGRVDNGNAFLDPEQLEKKRGITIFSHEAQLQTKNFELNLLDTPGHIDFASQTEEVLSVLDYAILVISAVDGITSYTKILWNLLSRYNIPCFIFINKMDSIGANKSNVLNLIHKNLNPNCIDFTSEDDNWLENIASSNDRLLEQYLNGKKIQKDQIKNLIFKRNIFPVYFGSALKLDGISQFISGLEKWTKEANWNNKKVLKARIFKISHDKKIRLTWLKVLQGTLHAKEELLPKQKIDEIRNYNSTKFSTLQTATAGKIVAVTGLQDTYPGQGIGISDLHDSIKPILSYHLNPGTNDIYQCLADLKILEDENPQLHVTWSEHLQEIHVQVMGEIQLEILQQLLQERFDLKVTFDEGNILYKETISQEIEAVGHFEPLRHYAEVHLLLEPGSNNSGLVLANKCSLEILNKNWQHQIMTALASKEPLGVLTGSPVTDIKITLISGKGSIVHSVGGDFREATYRAIRQGLMELKQRKACVLLEPWYEFHLEIPQNQVGRALNDIQKMNGEFSNPQNNDTMAVITGRAPVAHMRDYAQKVRNYTHGKGYLECIFAGYNKCHNAQEVIKKENYDPMSDLTNTPNSVFCSHGAGHTVTWDKVPEVVQYPYTYPLS